MKQQELQIQMEVMLDVLDSCGYSSGSVKNTLLQYLDL